MLTIYINYTTEYGEAPVQVSVSIEDETEFTFTEAYLPRLVADGYQFDGWMFDGRLVRAGDISNVISIDTTFELIAHWTVEKNYWGNASGGFGYPKSFVIVDEDGNEFTGVVTDEVKVFTATDNDVREGMIYASENGISTGTKDIPSYHTEYGSGVVLANNAAIIETSEYNYNNLFVMIITYDTSMSHSTSSTYVSINNGMYAVGNSEKVSDIIIDEVNEQINLGLTVSEKSVIKYLVTREEF